MPNIRTTIVIDEDLLDFADDVADAIHASMEFQTGQVVASVTRSSVIRRSIEIGLHELGVGYGLIEDEEDE